MIFLKKKTISGTAKVSKTYTRSQYTNYYKTAVYECILRTHCGVKRGTFSPPLENYSTICLLLQRSVLNIKNNNYLFNFYPPP